MTTTSWNLVITALIIVVTAGVNIAMANYGLAQKLSCTLEQSSAVAVAASAAALTH